MTDTTNSWTKRTDNINRIYRELSQLRATVMKRGYQTADENARGRALVSEYYDASSGVAAPWNKAVPVPVR